MRAMFKPMSRDPRSGSSRPSQTKAMPSRVRILFPWLQPAKPASFQKQQPVPKLPIIRAPVDRSKMPLNRGFSPFREADTLEDNPQRVQGQSIFAPKIIRKSEFESFSHDNKHLNNVSPNNKFTLLQVFVNKHNGRQYFDDPSRRTRQSMAQTNNNNNNLPPTRLSPEPFNQAAKSFQPNYRQPMIYPVRTSPYQTYPTSSFWPEQMPHHYHPYLMPQGYPSQFARVPMPFGPSDSLGLPYNPRPAEVRPLPRRPIEVRPLLVTHRRNEVHAEGAKSRYCCMMPLAPGRCKSYQTKWYYNRDSGKCEIFYYTGCAGNANNFETWEECAATCLETSSAPRSTVPPHIMSRLSTPEESLEQEEREEEEGEDTQQETIIITSTRFPENEAEEKQAMEEAKTVAPSVDQPISSTTERFEPVEKDENDEESDNGVLKEHQVVISEASLMSTHYIMLLAVITTVALAIIVLVSISSVHLCRKMRANKKEKILEAVIKQQLSTETPNIVYTTKPPSVEQTDKSQV